VLVDGQSVGAVTTYNFPAVSANHLITATFKPLEPDPGPGLTEQQLLIILKMLLGNSTVEEEE